MARSDPFAGGGFVVGGGGSNDASAAGNSTAAGSVLVAAAESLLRSATKTQLIVAGLLLMFSLLLHRLNNPPLDPREPPLLKPRIPVIGHLLNIIKYQAQFVGMLDFEEKPLVTLPILGGKIYALRDPALVQTLLNNTAFSFHPAMLSFVQTAAGLPREMIEPISSDEAIKECMRAIHMSFTPPELRRMNLVALAEIGKTMNGIDDELVVPNLFAWVKPLLNAATSEAMYAPHNPFPGGQGLEDIWVNEAGLRNIVMGLAPSFTVPDAMAARTRLQEDRLLPFFRARHDEKAGGYVRLHTAALRRCGMSDEVIGRYEMSTLHATMINATCLSFWLLAYIFTSPELAVALRAEAAELVTKHDGDREGKATVDIGGLEKRLPRLTAVYREVVRLCSKHMFSRNLSADTTVTDSSGREWLLKKGNVVQGSAVVSHRFEDAWGSDAMEFDPDRFLEDKNTGNSKIRRAAYHPFGGGLHYCPGRNFAFAEILGLAVVLLVGYDVEAVDVAAGRIVTDVPRPAFIDLTSINKPANGGEGFGMRMKRREGWEGVTWEFVSSE